MVRCEPGAGMTVWVVDQGGPDEWAFWIGLPRCDCGWFLADAKPVLSTSGGVRAVSGRCSRHGEVETRDFDIADVEP